MNPKLLYSILTYCKIMQDINSSRGRAKRHLLAIFTSCYILYTFKFNSFNKISAAHLKNIQWYKMISQILSNMS